MAFIIMLSRHPAQNNEENEGKHGIVSLFYPSLSLFKLRVMMICCV